MLRVCQRVRHLTASIMKIRACLFLQRCIPSTWHYMLTTCLLNMLNKGVFSLMMDIEDLVQDEGIDPCHFNGQIII